MGWTLWANSVCEWAKLMSLTLVPEKMPNKNTTLTKYNTDHHKSSLFTSLLSELWMLAGGASDESGEMFDFPSITIISSFRGWPCKGFPKPSVTGTGPVPSMLELLEVSFVFSFEAKKHHTVTWIKIINEACKLMQHICTTYIHFYSLCRLFSGLQKYVPNSVVEALKLVFLSYRFNTKEINSVL